MSEDIYSMTDQPTTAPLDLREFLCRASDPSIPGWERVVDAKHAATVIEQMAAALSRIEDHAAMHGGAGPKPGPFKSIHGTARTALSLIVRDREGGEWGETE
jgi:hypothetical protein